MTKQQVNINIKNELSQEESRVSEVKSSVKDSFLSTKTLRPFGTSIDNFYVTDLICENSAIMSKASKVRLKNNLFKEKSIYN